METPIVSAIGVPFMAALTEEPDHTTRVSSLPRGFAVVHSRQGAMDIEVPFLQLFCRAAMCGVMFLICRPCYRGQAYCSVECRLQTRRFQRTKANQRYEENAEVRQDHCQRQRDFRKRQCELRVTDQSSMIDCGGSSMSGLLAETGRVPTAGERAQDRPKQAWNGRFANLVCVICGRVGRFIKAFNRRE